MKCQIGKLTSGNNPANHQNCLDSAADATWKCQLSERNTQKECIEKGLDVYKRSCPINSRSAGLLLISDCHFRVYQSDFWPCHDHEKGTTDEQCKQRGTEAYKRECSSSETQPIQDPFSDCYISALREWHRCFLDGDKNCKQKVKDSAVYERCLRAAREPQRAAHWENVYGPPQEQSGGQPQVPEDSINRLKPDTQPPDDLSNRLSAVNTDHRQQHEPDGDHPEVKAPGDRDEPLKQPKATPAHQEHEIKDNPPKGSPAGIPTQSDRAGTIPQVEETSYMIVL